MCARGGYERSSRRVLRNSIPCFVLVEGNVDVVMFTGTNNYPDGVGTTKRALLLPIYFVHFSLLGVNNSAG